MADVVAKVRTTEHIQPAQEFPADIRPPSIPGTIEPIPNISGIYSRDNTIRLNFTTAPSCQHDT
jgi:hypothetical protein